MAIKIIIGLGNEGVAYQHTYHNAGRVVARQFESLAQAEGISVQFFEPDGFMNNIGLPIKRKINQTQFTSEEVLIVHDDSDLPLGEYRLTQGGSAAGHNGVSSVYQHLGADVWRLRIGIRDPHEKVRRKAGDFVLQRISLLKRLALKKVARAAWQQVVLATQGE